MTPGRRRRSAGACFISYLVQVQVQGVYVGGLRGQELDQEVTWRDCFKAQEHVLSRCCLALLLSRHAGARKELDKVQDAQEVPCFRSYVTGKK